MRRRAAARDRLSAEVRGTRVIVQANALPTRQEAERSRQPRETKPMKKMTMHAVIDRVQGSRPGVPRAAAVAASVGAATAVVVYRLLRHDADAE
jgi:hypothetical protein